MSRKMFSTELLLLVRSFCDFDMRLQFDVAMRWSRDIKLDCAIIGPLWKDRQLRFRSRLTCLPSTCIKISFANPLIQLSVFPDQTDGWGSQYIRLGDKNRNAGSFPTKVVLCNQRMERGKELEPHIHQEGGVYHWMFVSNR